MWWNTGGSVIDIKRGLEKLGCEVYALQKYRDLSR